MKTGAGHRVGVYGHTDTTGEEERDETLTGHG